MDTTLKNKAEALLGEPLLDEPVRPESWECCGSDCGDACIQTIYWSDKARYDAQQRKLKETGWSDDEENGKGRLKTVRLDGNRVFRRPFTFQKP